MYITASQQQIQWQRPFSDDRRKLLQYMMARGRSFYYDCFHCIQLPAAIVAVCTNDTNSQLRLLQSRHMFVYYAGNVDGQGSTRCLSMWLMNPLARNTRLKLYYCCLTTCYKLVKRLGPRGHRTAKREDSATCGRRHSTNVFGSQK